MKLNQVSFVPFYLMFYYFSPQAFFGRAKFRDIKDAAEKER
jgi:hypothetical protein